MSDIVERLRKMAEADYYGRDQPHFVPPEDCADVIESLDAEIERKHNEEDDVRNILAGTSIGSLPNDYTTAQMAERRMEEWDKFQWQVRDLREALEGVLNLMRGYGFEDAEAFAAAIRTLSAHKEGDA